MKIVISIPIDDHNRLKEHSRMLGRISNLVSNYASSPATTTYECVLKLYERERKLTETVHKLKAELKKLDASCIKSMNDEFVKHPNC